MYRLLGLLEVQFFVCDLASKCGALLLLIFYSWVGVLLSMAASVCVVFVSKWERMVSHVQVFGFVGSAVCCLWFSIKVQCSFVAEFLLMWWAVVLNGSERMWCIHQKDHVHHQEMKFVKWWRRTKQSHSSQVARCNWKLRESTLFVSHFAWIREVSKNQQIYNCKCSGDVRQYEKLHKLNDADKPQVFVCSWEIVWETFCRTVCCTGASLEVMSKTWKTFRLIWVCNLILWV